jgi:D-apiose dehydrogenase
VAACREADIPFYIHENFRFQTPIRAVKEALESEVIGTPFRARIEMISGFPVFQNQPFLRTLKHLIITDLGSHLLDIARFLFGEASRLYCQIQSVNSNIAGEDVATILLQMENGADVLVRMAYVENYLENDYFPQTTMFIEGSKGSIELAPLYWLRVTTKQGTHSRRFPPPRYPWADPDYDVVHSSIVPTNADILKELKGEGKSEITAEDNIKTVRLVFTSYDSAENQQAIFLNNEK